MRSIIWKDFSEMICYIELDVKSYTLTCCKGLKSNQVISLGLHVSGLSGSERFNCKTK